MADFYIYLLLLWWSIRFRWFEILKSPFMPQSASFRNTSLISHFNGFFFTIRVMSFFFAIRRFEKLPFHIGKMFCEIKKILIFLQFQLQRNSFQWYHEDSLPMQVVNAVQPLRPQILNDLKNCVTALITTQKVRTVYSISYPNFDRKLWGTEWNL